MPVRFLCTQCNTLLSVGRKKIGADIQCPKCTCAVRVPPEDNLPPAMAAKIAAQAAAQLASAAAAGTPGNGAAPAVTTGTATLERPAQPALPIQAVSAQPGPVSLVAPSPTQPASGVAGQAPFLLADGEIEGLIQEFIVYDDGEGPSGPILGATPNPTAPQATVSAQPAPLVVPSFTPTASSTPLVAAAVAPALPTQTVTGPATVPSPVAAVLAAPASPAAQAIPAGMVLVSRRMLYVQFLLVLALLGGAFGAGYTLGNADAKPQSLVVGPNEPIIEPVTVQGKLVYLAQPGKLAGDQGAVVLVLPEDVYPSQKVRTQGLRPTDPVNLTHERAAVELLQAGGVQVRADGKGEFLMNVPRPGKYHLLIVSRNSDRNKAANETDLALLNRYFDDAGQLLGSHKYYLAPMQFVGSFMELPPHDFGAVK